ATHVGAWEMFRKKRAGPVITTETKDQSPETIAALDEMLVYLNRTLFKKVNTILQNDYPELWVCGQRAQARLSQRLKKAYTQRPALRFGPAFCCVAFKVGSSEVVHLDFNDDKRFLTWCMPVGDWTGANFVIPQLGISIPILPGKMYAVLAGIVAHCSTPITSGNRLIFTGFMEKTVLQRADAAFFKNSMVYTDISTL
ncbi:hypothetical protein C8J56DRAFT_785672, partial [Mycena floridula]